MDNVANNERSSPFTMIEFSVIHGLSEVIEFILSTKEQFNLYFFNKRLLIYKLFTISLPLLMTHVLLLSQRSL